MPILTIAVDLGDETRPPRIEWYQNGFPSVVHLQQAIKAVENDILQYEMQKIEAQREEIARAMPEEVAKRTNRNGRKLKLVDEVPA